MTCFAACSASLRLRLLHKLPVGVLVDDLVTLGSARPRGSFQARLGQGRSWPTKRPRPSRRASASPPATMRAFTAMQLVRSISVLMLSVRAHAGRSRCSRSASFLLLHVLLDEVLDVDVYARLCAVWASWPLGDGSRIDLRIVLEGDPVERVAGELAQVVPVGLAEVGAALPVLGVALLRAAWWSRSASRPGRRGWRRSRRMPRGTRP